MALVQFGGGITRMSGSIAGNTFARNRYGNYVRSRTKPVNPNTDLQDQYRSAVALLTARWASTLTAAQRTAWNLYASNVAMLNKLSETIHLSGFNHYIRSNTIIARIGLTIVDAGPVVFEIPAQDPAFSIAISEATQQITATFNDTLDWDNETGGYLYHFQGQPQNAQRNFFDGPWRNYGMVSGVTGAPVASPQVGAVQFAVAEGQRVWVYSRIQRADGRLSQRFRDSVIVGA